MTTCDELSALLPSRPLGVLEAATARSVDEHAASCGACAELLRDIEGALAGPALEASTERAWERLEERLRAPVAVRVVLSCTFCHDALESAGASYCARCLAPHHRECFVEHGRCSAAGCGEVNLVEARAARPARGRAWRVLGAAAALVLLSGGGFLLQRAAHVSPRPALSPEEQQLVALGLDPKLGSSWLARAKALEGMGRIDEALQAYTRAFALDPSLANALADALRGRALRREEKDELDLALADLRRAIEVAPTKAALYAERARIVDRKGDLEAALADLDRALALDPQEARVWLRRGAIRGRTGCLVEARHDFDRALALDPRLAEAWANRARCKLAAGDTDGAIADATRAIELSPQTAATWSIRGAARGSRGDTREALVDFSTALELEPTAAEALIARGTLHEKLGELDAALRDFERALELAPAAAVSSHVQTLRARRR